MEVGTTTNNNLTARLPLLNPGDYDLWLMRIEQYFLMNDYSLWEVIKNGKKVLRRTIGTVKQEYEPTTAEEKQDRRNEMKARATLSWHFQTKTQLEVPLINEECKVANGGYREKLEIQGEVINQEDMNLKLLRSLPSEWKYHALIWRNKVWINQKSQENSQKRANTNTEIRRAQKKPRIQSRSQEKSTMVKLQSKKVKPWSTEVNR
ncbi:hypothetical protein Tco_1182793 [Tanacetum coccineum]